PAAAAILDAFSTGGVRYRMDWGASGRFGAADRATVQALAKRRPDWVNDTSQRNWDIEFNESPYGVAMELRPRGPDPRFAYRVGDVAAASHPTIAAALARLGGVKANDVVWDPFVGSGLELIERARLGPFKQLHGTDLDPRAIEVARANLDS